VVAILVAFAGVLRARAATAAEVWAAVMSVPFRDIEVSWIPYCGFFTKLAWGLHA
jgi:hypothetical protein